MRAVLRKRGVPYWRADTVGSEPAIKMNFRSNGHLSLMLIAEHNVHGASGMSLMRL